MQFMNLTENLKSSNVTVDFFRDQVNVVMDFLDNTDNHLYMCVICPHLDLQVSSMAQFFQTFSQTFPAVKLLTISSKVYSYSSKEHNEVDHAEWHKLLRLF